MIKALNYKINYIEVLPIGANIKTNMELNTNSWHLFLVSIAGLFMQVILFIFLYLIFKNNFISYNTYNLFFRYNLIILVFNMLPIYPLDGLKALTSLLEIFFSFHTSLIISYILSSIFLLFFFYLNYIYKFDNYLIIIFLLVKLILYIKEYKLIMKKFLLERYLSNKKYKKVKYVKKITGIKKNYYNFINNISEKKVLDLKFQHY